MPIPYQCACGQCYLFDDSFAGRYGRCSACEAKFTLGTTPAPWACPRCASDSIQRLEVIHAGGTTQSRGVALGGAHELRGAARNALIGGVSFGRSSTALAEHVAPPEAPRPEAGCSEMVAMLGIGFLGLVGFAVVAGIYGTIERSGFDPSDPTGLIVAGAVLAAVAAGIVLLWTNARGASKRATKEYRARHAEYLIQFEIWKNQFFCHRCGEVSLYVGKKR